MISQKTIEEVRAKAHLLDIIGETVQLKRAGSSYVGLCPFHNERSPSFHVRDDEYFHCFGCGKSGNMFTFVMESRGLSFPEAVEELAQRYGIEVERSGGRIKKETGQNTQALYDLNQKALTFFRSQLQLRDPKVVAYAKERRLTKESVQAFGIGFAPLGNTLCAFAAKEKVPEALMVQSGLARRNTRGDLYDALRGRLVFPIFIDHKRVAGFGGRVIPELQEKDSTAPKYLNSPESPIYHKSKVLFGLPQAMTAIKERASVYVVEGYMDVIGLWQVGVRNVVATCGTALTEEHVKRLSRITKRVALLFDADTAGRAAAAKSFLTFLNAPVDVWAVYLEEGEDPDSAALQYGTETDKYLDALPRVSLFDSYFEAQLKQYGVSSIDELGPSMRGTFAAEIGGVLAKVKDSIARLERARHAASRLKIPFERFESILEQRPSQNKQPLELVESVEKNSVPEASVQKYSDLPRLDQSVLSLVMGRKEEFVARVLHDAALSQALSPVARGFIETLSLILERTDAEDAKKEQVKELLKHYGASWTDHWKLAHEMFLDKATNPHKQFDDCVRAARKTELSRVIERHHRTIATLHDDTEKAQLFQEVVALERQLRSLGA